MKLILRGIAAFLLLALACLAQPAIGGYPEKPIRLIVTFPAGGVTDILGRTIAQKLSERLGQPVIVDNRGGMGGSIGTQVVARAAPDGYTIVLSNAGSFTLNTVLYKDVGYDPLKDFDPVISVASVTNILVVPTASPYKSLAELISAARAKPGSLTYASTGIGASPYLGSELLKQVAKVDITEVTYKGAAPALIDVISGQVDMIFEAAATSMPHIKSGKLRPLAASGLKRVSVLPDVPTVAEQGYPGFDVVAWFGIWAPAGTPREILQKLNAEIDAILRLPDVVERLTGMGVELTGGSREMFSAYHRSEFDKWTTFLRNTGIKAQ
jgi:tripartite-type tricarboxylate transporter receptor subunit TctC